MSQVAQALPAQARRTDRAAPVPAGLVGGIGGFAFVLTVVIQNLVQAHGMPANDATAAKVTTYFAGHLGTTELLAALYPIGAIGLACYLAAMLTRLAGERRAPAIAGGFGAVGIIAMFTMTLATNVALAEYVHRGAASAAAVDALWILHNAVFAVLLVSIGVALVGLSAAAAAAGLVANAWKGIGLLGGVALLVAGAFAPAIADGSKVLIVGLVGFVAWLLFVALSSAALLRQHR